MHINKGYLLKILQAQEWAVLPSACAEVVIHVLDPGCVGHCISRQ